MPWIHGRACWLALLLVLPGPPVEAAPSPRQLLEVHDLSGPAISPDGRFVAVREEQASVELNAYDSAWYVLPLNGRGSGMQVADGGSPLFTDAGTVISEPPQWSPDSRWIYYRALLSGGIQVWRAASDGSRAEAVTRDDADVEAFRLSPDGRELIYRMGAPRAAIVQAEAAEYDQGVRIDAHTPIGQGLYHGGLVNGRAASLRMTGDWSRRAGLLGEAPRRWTWVDLDRRRAREVNEADLPSWASLIETTASAGSAGAVLTARAAQTGDIATVSFGAARMVMRVTRAAAPDAPISCLAPACQGAAFAAIAWWPGRDAVVFTTTDHQRGRAQSLRVWTPASGAVRTIVRAPGLVGGGRGLGVDESCAVGAVYAACVSAAADDPPRLDRIDLETGASLTLFAPNQVLAEATGPRVRLLRWSDPAGQQFTGWLYPPAGNKAAGPAPLFISYYVCSGFLRGGFGDEWPLASLAGAGIAALCINEPRIDPRHLDQVARYDTALSGVRAIIGQLAETGAIDPKRVGMGGLSFGSEVTFWLAMNSHLLAAGSVTSPAATPTYYRLHSLQGDGFKAALKRIWGLGAPEETPDRWKLLSPADNLDRLRTPMLLQMPEQEYLEAMDYFIPMAQSATPTEMYVFPQEPHIKVQPRHKLAAYERNLDWFRFWLQGSIDPDPAKAAQYQGWEAMRLRQAQAPPRPSSGNHDGAALP